MMTTCPILITLEEGKPYAVYYDASWESMVCFSTSRKSYSLQFVTTEESWAKLPYTWYNVGCNYLSIQDLMLLFIWWIFDYQSLKYRLLRGFQFNAMNGEKSI